MRIAVACSGLSVAARYESAQDLTCYNVNRGIIVGCQNMPFPKMPAGEMARTLKSLGIDVLIVGAVKKGAEKHFREEGIDVVSGVEGSPRDAAAAYLTEKLWGTDDIPKRKLPKKSKDN